MKQILDDYIAVCSHSLSDEERINLLVSTAKRIAPMATLSDEEWAVLARHTIANESSTEGWDGVTI